MMGSSDTDKTPLILLQSAVEDLLANPRALGYMDGWAESPRWTALFLAACRVVRPSEPETVVRRSCGYVEEIQHQRFCPFKEFFTQDGAPCKFCGGERRLIERHDETEIVLTPAVSVERTYSQDEDGELRVGIWQDQSDPTTIDPTVTGT